MISQKKSPAILLEGRQEVINCPILCFVPNETNFCLDVFFSLMLEQILAEPDTYLKLGDSVDRKIFSTFRNRCAPIPKLQTPACL